MELQDTPKDIYDYIVQEEIEFSKGIDILGWEWSMADHIKTSFFYKHGRLLNGNDDETPVKNITKPILNMQYWAEDIDVKDLVLYIENEDKHHLSFLVKKYHDEVFLKENNLDSLFDEINQSRIDYGGGLVMDVGKARPQRMDLETICFCNQSNMLSSPIGFKLYLSPNDLQDMEDRGWGDKENGATHTIDEAIILSRSQVGSEGGNHVRTPSEKTGKYIQAYLVVGSMPKAYLEGESVKYVYQMQVVCFYKGEGEDGKDEKKGITLFAKQCKNPFKLIKRDEVFGRALGYGGAEELFEPQAWTTYSEIQKKEMMAAAGKILHVTDDDEFVKRNHSLKSVDNNEVLLLGENKTIRQMDTYPRNIALLDKSINEWQDYAQQIGGAPSPLMGESPTAGTPFKLQELVTQTGKSPHEWRSGQYAKFLEEIYRDWIIPYIAKEITKGQKFLATLEQEEMEAISEMVIKNAVKDMEAEKVLSGIVPLPEETEAFKIKLKEDFMKDNQKFLEILKDELKDINMNISINIDGKQKSLIAMADSVSNIMNKALSTYDPNTKSFAIFDDPRMAKMLNKILEYSNMSSIDFNNYSPPKTEVPQPAPVPAVQ